MMKPKLIVVLPEKTKADSNTSDLLLDLFGVARQHHLILAVRQGDCISPISVEGDLELEEAEGIKQEALHYVKSYQKNLG